MIREVCRDDAEIIFVRLFRLWAMERHGSGMGLSRIHEVARELGMPDETGVACASLFQLVENELGRPLVRECCCSKDLSADERALLGIVKVAAHLEPGSGSTDIPHGLPGAIHWAALAVRRAFGVSDRDIARDAVSEGTLCPFSNPRSAA